ncbi:MAG: T9SS type A sorting domain-containing protein, partial [Bacteroidales bacterium]|nr:T9SS type A sorting domain-containing protein [Bacteroidales bacterium]
TINWLSGNIDADPLWEETGDHPYALKAGSPCINTGTPMYEPGMQPPYIIQQDTVYKLITLDFDTIPLPSTDLAGNPRIAYGRIDMGAYEFADTTTQITNHKSQITNNQVTVFPNPFTSNAFISFQTNTKGKVRAAIYNLNGQLVKKLTETEAVPGSYSINWDGTDNFGFEVNPGAYIVSVEVNGLKAGSVKVVKKKRK